MSRTYDDSSVGPARLTRRRALTGAATTGLALPVLAACADGEPSPGAPAASSATPPGTTSDIPTSAAAPETSSTETSSTETGAEAVASVEDVPVGGGVIVTDSRVVVTQPVAGEFRCFSAVCPHQSCLVSGISTTITCTCHNSSFDIATGEVLGGPSPAPLAPVDFTINENQVVLS